jgi:8-oxo-dGTP pyrophosphatase MutT (NUDIX family)
LRTRPAPDRRQDLRALVEQYRGESEKERDDRLRLLELLRSTEDPFARDQFDPGHVTASAFVLSPREDALLLILHGRLHKWLQPGGHVEPTDASVLEAARREVEEETGVPAASLFAATPRIFDVDVHPIPARRHEPAHQHFDVRFLLRARTTVLHQGYEVRAVRWVPWAEIARLDTDASVLRAVARLQDEAG